jgi:hypothetical protein
VCDVLKENLPPTLKLESHWTFEKEIIHGFRFSVHVQKIVYKWECLCNDPQHNKISTVKEDK